MASLDSLGSLRVLLPGELRPVGEPQAQCPPGNERWLEAGGELDDCDGPKWAFLTCEDVKILLAVVEVGGRTGQPIASLSSFRGVTVINSPNDDPILVELQPRGGHRRVSGARFATHPLAKVLRHLSFYGGGFGVSVRFAAGLAGGKAEAAYERLASMEVEEVERWLEGAIGETSRDLESVDERLVVGRLIVERVSALSAWLEPSRRVLQARGWRAVYERVLRMPAMASAVMAFHRERGFLGRGGTERFLRWAEGIVPALSARFEGDRVRMRVGAALITGLVGSMPLNCGGQQLVPAKEAYRFAEAVRAQSFLLVTEVLAEVVDELRPIPGARERLMALFGHSGEGLHGWLQRALHYFGNGHGAWLSPPYDSVLSEVVGILGLDECDPATGRDE